MKSFKEFKKSKINADEVEDKYTGPDKNLLPVAKIDEPGKEIKLKGGDKLIFHPDKGDVNIVEEGQHANSDEKDTAVVAWGRMNPPTVGHAKLVNKLKSLAKEHNAKPYLFLSHSQDKDSNPLPYNDKVKYARAAFGDIVKSSKHKTIIDVMKALHGKHKHVVVVAGQDRLNDFSKLLNAYNGKEYNFDAIHVVSAGARDEHASDITGMSASKMRSAVKRNDLTAFKAGLPSQLHKHAQKIFDNLKRHMHILEGYTGLIEIEDENELLGIIESMLTYLEKPNTYQSEASIIRNISNDKYWE